MKKFLVAVIAFLTVTFAFAQEEQNSKTFHPLNIQIDEGISYCQLTVIQKQQTRSNFVRETMMVGAYVSFETQNFYKNLDFKTQFDGYYPFYNAFNGMKQFPKNKINYAFGNLTGIVYDFDQIKYVPIDLTLGMHSMYQLTDSYHMWYIGLGFQGALNFPLTKYITICNNYFLSIDNPNMGSNKIIEPFDFAYQWHIDLGVSFSKRCQNSYYYIAKK